MKNLISSGTEMYPGILLKLRRAAFRMLVFYLFFQTGQGAGQTYELHGRILDQVTGVPVPNVNIQKLGTREGITTDRQGKFTLPLKVLPVTLAISCVGYQSMQFTLKTQPDKPVELLLNPAVNTLKEVDIRAKRYDYLFRDNLYYILDYEIMDSSLLLLVFRSRLKNSSLIIMNMSGDTLALAQVPEPNPVSLYRDCLKNIHYLSSRGSAFQIQFDSELFTIQYPFRTSRDTLMRLVSQYLFRAGERLYFEEYFPDRSGKQYGYLLPGGKKIYLRALQEENRDGNIRNEIRFLHQWNHSLGNTRRSLLPAADPGTKVPAMPTQSDQDYMPVASGQEIQFIIRAFYRGIHTRMIRLTDTTLALFDFVNGWVDVLTPEGEPVSRSAISFHKEADQNLVAGLLGVFIPLHDWKWTGEILVDERTGEVYAPFRKNMSFQVRKIDLVSGKAGTGRIFPFSYPEKVRIYNGAAYFLITEIRQDCSGQRLVKFRL